MCSWDPYQVGLYYFYNLIIQFNFTVLPVIFLLFLRFLLFCFLLYFLFIKFFFSSLFFFYHLTVFILFTGFSFCARVCVCVAVWSHACRALRKQISISVNSCGGLLILCVRACACVCVCVRVCVWLGSRSTSLTHHLCPVSPCGFTRWALLSWQVSGSLLESCYSDWTFQSCLLFNFLCAAHRVFLHELLQKNKEVAAVIFSVFAVLLHFIISNG